MKGLHALLVFGLLTAAAGCSNDPPARATDTAPIGTTSTPGHAAIGTPGSTASPARPGTAVASPVAWATTPTTVAHQPPVPPVPVVTAIRYAAHRDGYDRVVLDIPGALPGYTVKYVKEVRRDGSGEPVSMPGSAFLLIVLHPAQAHRADGTPTVTGVHRIGLPGIKSYAVVGDYEGYVSIALGVTGVRKYHVGELSNRIYIDVAV
jgi:hypothetical protein